MTNEEQATAETTNETLEDSTVEAPKAEAAELTKPASESSSETSQEQQAAKTEASEIAAPETSVPDTPSTDEAPVETETVGLAETASDDSPSSESTPETEAPSEPETPPEPETVLETVSKPEPTSAEPAKAAHSTASSAAVVEEGPTAPQQVTAEPLSLEELAKQSPTLAPAIEAHLNKTPITGKVIGWNKGGFHVALDGIPAFCPKSQMEIGNPKRAHAYIDRELQFTIAEIRENGKRIVVHRKGLLRLQRQDAIQSLKDKSTSGEPISGKVTSVTDFGAFVDVGGIEGLVHLSQLARQRVEKPSDVVKVGQEVAVRVLKVEKGGDRISLSMKALEPDPWKTADENFEIGGKFVGKVVRSTDFGLFVDVGNGMEGLLHSSQLEIKKSLSDYPEGSDVEGWIREVDGGRRRLSLSLREVAKGNPWQDLGARYEEGQQIDGTIEQVAKFGVFVLLEPGLSGLLPFSATRPEGAGNMLPQRRYNPGETINVQIAAIDAKRKRISLAPVGSKLEGTKADLRDFQKIAAPTGLSAMAAAFAKLQQGS